MLLQIVQLVGAVLVLAAFVAAQLQKVSTESRRYLALNLLGSGALAAVAMIERQWGFILLEGVWAIVSAAALLRTAGVGRPG